VVIIELIGYRRSVMQWAPQGDTPLVIAKCSFYAAAPWGQYNPRT